MESVRINEPGICGVVGSGSNALSLLCREPRGHPGSHGWQEPEWCGQFQSPRESVTMADLIRLISDDVARQVEERLAPLLEAILRQQGK